MQARFLRFAATLMLLAGAATAATGLGGDAVAEAVHAGEISSASTYSAALAGPIDYEIYLPYGYAAAPERRYPTLYLLHGRGDSMAAWTQEKTDLDRLIDTGAIPPVIVVMPDAPWSDRGSWYVNSRYTGTDYPGKQVETALTRDLVRHIDATYHTVASRWARAIGGYSMGGAGALRYGLAHQDVFAAAIVLSPAVYTPSPPSDSSVRDYGAYGVGKRKFVESRYQQLNYPALLKRFDPKLPVHFFLAVGDDDNYFAKPADAKHALDFEEAVAYNKLIQVHGVTAEWRVLNGGHDWDTWEPAFVAGVQDVFGYIGTSAPTLLEGQLIGTAGDDRAGGVVADATGTTVGLAAAGSIDGKRYAGGLDAVVTRRGPTGATQWTTEFGTTGDDRLYGVVAGAGGRTYAAGYTHGNLDGAHPGNAADDMLVAAVNADGSLAWVRQFGDPTQADRAYAIAPDGAGGVYLAGYTKGSIGGTANSGDKDAVLARVDEAGNVLWTRQFGGAGEDKGLALATDAHGVYVAGVTSGAMPGGTAAGATDGWIASFDSAGTRRWLRQIGTPADDQINGVTVDTAGDPIVVGSTGGALDGHNAGGSDLFVAKLDGTGNTVWTRQIGTAGDDAGFDIAARSDGDVTIAGCTDGKLTAKIGGTDLIAATLSDNGTVASTGQLGTIGNDGLDDSGEGNLFMAAGPGDGLWLTGLTYGDLATASNHGAGDVFLSRL